MKKENNYQRFKITEHPELRHNRIINIATGKQIGVVIWTREEDSKNHHIRITDVNKELTSSELIELVEMINDPQSYYEYRGLYGK